MAFQGSLRELPLPDVIQLVAVSGKTGAFQIENGPVNGKIYLRNGQIVHASTEGYTEKATAKSNLEGLAAAVTEWAA